MKWILILCGWTLVALLFAAQQIVVEKVQGSQVLREHHGEQDEHGESCNDIALRLLGGVLPSGFVGVLLMG